MKNTIIYSFQSGTAGVEKKRFESSTSIHNRQADKSAVIIQQKKKKKKKKENKENKKVTKRSRGSGEEEKEKHGKVVTSCVSRSRRATPRSRSADLTA